MGEIKHRHGPWRAYQNAVRGPGGELICCTSTESTDLPEAEKRARFIAAAPDLLAAAHGLIDEFADFDDDALRDAASADPKDLWIIGGRTLNAHFAKAVLATRAAIAKAEDASA